MLKNIIIKVIKIIKHLSNKLWRYRKCFYKHSVIIKYDIYYHLTHHGGSTAERRYMGRYDIPYCPRRVYFNYTEEIVVISYCQKCKDGYKEHSIWDDIMYNKNKYY